jgi:hypothetical protein
MQKMETSMIQNDTMNNMSNGNGMRLLDDSHRVVTTMAERPRAEDPFPDPEVLVIPSSDCVVQSQKEGSKDARLSYSIPLCLNDSFQSLKTTGSVHSQSNSHSANYDTHPPPPEAALPESYCCLSAPPERSDVVSVTVYKPMVDSLVGVSLIQKRHGITIGVMKPNSLFHDTELRVGMKLLAINDIDCTDPENNVTSHVAAALLRSCSGNVTIIATEEVDDDDDDDTPTTSSSVLEVVTIQKASKDTKVGLGIIDWYCKDNGKTIPVISSIAEDSLVANTALKPQMRMLTLNGICCRGQKDTIAMLRNMEGSIVIVAGSIDMVAVTVVITNSNSDDSPLGINMQQDIDGKLVVSELSGLFAETDLEVGMTLVQVNGVRVEQMQPAHVRAFLDQGQGTVLVIARKQRKYRGHKTKQPAPIKNNQQQQQPTTSGKTPPSSNNKASVVVPARVHETCCIIL